MDKGFQQVDILTEVVLQFSSEFWIHRCALLAGNILPFDRLVDLIDALCETDSECLASFSKEIIDRFGRVEQAVEEL